jgi:hypothetical protein
VVGSGIFNVLVRWQAVGDEVSPKQVPRAAIIRPVQALFTEDGSAMEEALEGP